MKKVVTLTLNPTIDKSSAVDNVSSEIKLRCDPPRYDPGGGGINVSRALHKVGGDSTAIYSAGGGPGNMLTQLLTDEGIRCEPVLIEGMTRENMTIFERQSGLQFRFGMPGPMMSAADWTRCTDAILAQNADYVVASGSLAPGIPDDYYAILTEKVRAQGGKVIIDSSGAALEAMRGAQAFLLKPNLYELEILSGEKFQGEDQLKAVSQRLIADGMAEVLVISMGAQGAMFVTADAFLQMRPPVVPIRSKVGAGDSMVGGIMYGLAQNRSLMDAVRYGIAAGTAAVMTDGTQLCRKDDVEMIYERVAIT
ncbi:MAG: 1-phosphofructokinase family hexose kinase [Aggregatilineales bacterium]